MNKRVLLIGMFFLVLQPMALAYLDEVLMTPDEIWSATKLVLEPTGIASENKASYTIKSKWMEDIIRKEKKLLPRAVGGGPTMARTVRRRCQMTVVLKELPTGTQIQISGKYQERPLSAPEHQARWKFVKPSTEDYELERLLFFKILREMSRIKSSQN
jgi:hypothetical protein